VPEWETLGVESRPPLDRGSGVAVCPGKNARAAGDSGNWAATFHLFSVGLMPFVLVGLTRETAQAYCSWAGMLQALST
jgi:hypothetical protein